MADKPDTRLEDLDVREVSIVDRPANERRFLVVKNRDGSTEEYDMPGKRRAIPASEATLVNKDDDTNVFAGLFDDDVVDPKPEDKVEDKPADDPKADDDVPVEKKAAGELLTKLTATLQRMTTVVTQAKKLGDRDMSPAMASAIKEIQDALSGGTDDKVADDKATDDKDAAVDKLDDGVLAMLNTATEKLVALVTKLKAAVEKDAKAEAPDVTGDLNGIAKILGAVLAKGGGKGEQAQAKVEGQVETKKSDDPKPEPTPEPKADAADDDDDDDPLFEVFKAAGSEEEDPIVVLKVGAKMKRGRLSKFRKALESLKSILDELGGEGKEAKEEKVTKADDAIVGAIEAMTEKITARMDKTDEAVASVAKRVDTVENVRPVGNGDDDPTTVEKNDNKEDKLWAGIIS